MFLQLRSLAHPNIVKFVGVCIEPPHLCIVTEFVERGSLSKLLADPMIVIDEPLILRVLQLLLSQLQLLFFSTSEMSSHTVILIHFIYGPE
jgi:serine/threonine protein kinase